MNRLYLLLITCGILVGCRGARESVRKEPSDQSLKDFLSSYERTFDPTVYDAQLNRVQTEARALSKGINPDSLLISAVAETTDGFRVQIAFTQEIDQAAQLRDTISSLLADEWVYVVYDAPYYKVRVGNFLDRPSASRMMEHLIARGYSEAWIVPDRVIKNPSPKPPPLPREGPQNEVHH
jgi:hypothetical protein